ncbi:voltage-dependent anion channel [Mycena metata]|uniref:Voltage-dependent anion channel n=1 Tax=Mycena metata TaxID=1033252 RepID=A0AAD7MIT4_9AGAR|nr:voltage-dependent anion channel [Mycena metata]
MAPRSRTQSSSYDPEATKVEPQTQSQVKSVPFLDRLEHFTWAWFTLPMATGGMALLLAPQTQPHTFTGLETIGKVVYIWDLFLFTAVTLCITYRFVRFPGTLVASLTHPTESLFAATPLLSLASIIAAIARYGVPSAGTWLIVTYRILFWVYFVVSFVAAVGLYFLLFTSPALKLSDMSPAWDLPIFPFMLSGTIASAGAALQPPVQAVPMIVAGLTAQGLGMMISILMYSNYIHRMIQYGFPSPQSRAGMFIAVGPPSFTSLALIGMANDFPAAYRAYFGAPETTVQIMRVMATATAVFIWSLSLWFFCITVLACLAARTQMHFHLNWWAFVFPNVGFTIATISIGKMFDSPAVGWVGSAMTILLVITYLAVGWQHARAFVRRDILSQGKDEDTYWGERDHKTEKSLERAGTGEGVIVRP